MIYTSSTNHYLTLGISHGASPSEIKKAYIKLAKKFHPDKNINCVEQAEKKFKRIVEAYKTLIDDANRQKYDATQRPTEPCKHRNRTHPTSDATDNHEPKFSRPQSSATNRKEYEPHHYRYSFKTREFGEFIHSFKPNIFDSGCNHDNCFSAREEWRRLVPDLLSYDRSYHRSYYYDRF